MLDQKYELQKSIATIKENSRITTSKSVRWHGVLIIGATPTEGPDRQKSFELFSCQLQGCVVITFLDEASSKLKLLLRFLSEASPEAKQNAGN